MLLTLGNVALRMITGTECGAVAKAHRAFASDTAPREWCGTIGTLNLTRDAMGRRVCEKRVRPEAAAAIEDEASALRAAAQACAWVNPCVAGALRATADDLEAEIRMECERARAIALRAAICRGGAVYRNLRIATPRPRPELSDADTFVYDFVEGAPLRCGVDRDVVERYVKCFFMLMHRDGILLLDPSATNAIVRPDGELVLIDAGATRTMTSAERAMARRLHLARTENDVREALGGETSIESIARAVWQYTLPFWEPQRTFPLANEAVHLLLSATPLSFQLPPGVASIARAVFGMVRTVQQLGFNAMDTRPFMLEIRALYSQPQSHSYSPSYSVTMTSSSSAGR